MNFQNAKMHAQPSCRRLVPVVNKISQFTTLSTNISTKFTTLSTKLQRYYST